jgi:hypothetical protein
MAVFTGTVHKQESIRSLTVAELEYIIDNETDSSADTPPHQNVVLATAELARRGLSGAGYAYALSPDAYPAGFSGISGFAGDAKSGFTGATGDSGVSGYDGVSGYSGYDGATGDSGFSGYSGYGP